MNTNVNFIKQQVDNLQLIVSSLVHNVNSLSDNIRSIDEYSRITMERLLDYISSQPSISFPTVDASDNLTINDSGDTAHVTFDTYDFIATIDAVSEPSSITTVTIPRYIYRDNFLYLVARIGDSAFANCTALTTINLPTSITNIGNAAFSGCTSLASFTFPQSAAVFGTSMFAGCTALTTITLPPSMSYIPAEAFKGTGLRSITLHEGLIYIGPSAFAECTSLAGTITFPSSLDLIDESAFENCSALTAVEYAEGSNMNTIGIKAFKGCAGVATFKIPLLVDTIGEEAFANCTTANTFSIPNGVKSIGKNAFLNHSNEAVTVLIDNETDAYPVIGYTKEMIDESGLANRSNVTVKYPAKTMEKVEIVRVYGETRTIEAIAEDT